MEWQAPGLDPVCRVTKCRVIGMNGETRHITSTAFIPHTKNEHSTSRTTSTFWSVRGVSLPVSGIKLTTVGVLYCRSWATGRSGSRQMHGYSMDIFVLIRTHTHENPYSCIRQARIFPRINYPWIQVRVRIYPGIYIEIYEYIILWINYS
jgi:hypothetical protein